MNTNDHYVNKLDEGSRLLDVTLYPEDYPTHDEYRQAVLNRLIRARDCFYEAFDQATTQYDRDFLRPLLDEAENIVRDLQMAKTT